MHHSAIVKDRVKDREKEKQRTGEEGEEDEVRFVILHCWLPPTVSSRNFVRRYFDTRFPSLPGRIRRLTSSISRRTEDTG